MGGKLMVTLTYPAIHWYAGSPSPHLVAGPPEVDDDPPFPKPVKVPPLNKSLSSFPFKKRKGELLQSLSLPHCL